MSDKSLRDILIESHEYQYCVGGENLTLQHLNKDKAITAIKKLLLEKIDTLDCHVYWLEDVINKDDIKKMVEEL